MDLLLDEKTGFRIADLSEPLLPEGFVTDQDQRDRSLSGMIISASGWRKVFAADGDENSPQEAVLSTDLHLAACAAAAYLEFLKEETGHDDPLIVIGMDCRPTGPLLADAMIRCLLFQKARIRSLFIAAAPEIMACTRFTPDAAGFIYISASHNPFGHNGFKFGLNDGGVLNGQNAAKVASLFNRIYHDQDESEKIIAAIRGTPQDLLASAHLSCGENKAKALRQYAQFTKEVVTGKEIIKDQEAAFARILKFEKPLGLVAEFNGSARCVSIDIPFLKAAGFRFKTFNDFPREVVHRIVPEGDSLDLCRELLDKAHEQDSAFCLGYVPDNDGDRGNFVYYDETRKTTRALDAQEVFALVVLAELAQIKTETPQKNKKIAVVVNDPTSLRIDEIAGRFGAVVRRAEVGEANVVELADQLRIQGYTVRVLGEGSNGGNITHPSRVRDPISTVFSLAKLLLTKKNSGGPGLFEYWCNCSGQEKRFSKTVSLADVVATLPAYVTTSAYDERALMHIKSGDHAKLKLRLEGIFLKDWELKKAKLSKDFGIEDYEEINYEKTEEKKGFGPEYRSGAQKGGIKFQFLDQDRKAVAWMWGRGSGTEPVFRIMADVKGNRPEMEHMLLEWMRSLIQKADA